MVRRRVVNDRRGVLKNSRYRGWWKYGETEAIFVVEGDYDRQIPRVKPIKEMQVESLRIVCDAAWHAAQMRLAKESRNRGRKPKEGDCTPRPRILHGLYYCPDHERKLYVGGPGGRSMYCRKCRGVTEPPQKSLPNDCVAIDP
jgi:hypothetical protein